MVDLGSPGRIPATIIHKKHRAPMEVVRRRYEVTIRLIAFDNPLSYHGATAHGGFDEVGSFGLPVD